LKKLANKMAVSFAEVEQYFGVSEKEAKNPTRQQVRSHMTRVLGNLNAAHTEFDENEDLPLFRNCRDNFDDYVRFKALASELGIKTKKITLSHFLTPKGSRHAALLKAMVAAARFKRKCQDIKNDYEQQQEENARREDVAIKDKLDQQKKLAAVKVEAKRDVAEAESIKAETLRIQKEGQALGQTLNSRNLEMQEVKEKKKKLENEYKALHSKLKTVETQYTDLQTKIVDNPELLKSEVHRHTKLDKTKREIAQEKEGVQTEENYRKIAWQKVLAGIQENQKLSSEALQKKTRADQLDQSKATLEGECKALKDSVEELETEHRDLTKKHEQESNQEQDEKKHMHSNAERARKRQREAARALGNREDFQRKVADHRENSNRVVGEYAERERRARAGVQEERNKANAEMARKEKFLEEWNSRVKKTVQSTFQVLPNLRI